MKILNFLSGYKTFIIGICAIIWGIHTNDINIIAIGASAIGLRQAVSKVEKK